MPSPISPVLDQFHGVAGTTLPNYSPQSWKSYLPGVVADAVIAPDQSAAKTPGGFGGNYYTQILSPDQEAFLTVKVLPSSTLTSAASIDLRITIPGSNSAVTRYIFGWNYNSAAADVYLLYWVVNGSAATLITSANGPDLNAGDKLWFTCIGTTLTGYAYTSGAWVQVVQATDTHIQQAGYAAWYVGNNSSTEITDWGAGSFTGGTLGGPAPLVGRFP